MEEKSYKQKYEEQRRSIIKLLSKKYESGEIEFSTKPNNSEKDLLPIYRGVYKDLEFLIDVYSPNKKTITACYLTVNDLSKGQKQLFFANESDIKHRVAINDLSPIYSIYEDIRSKEKEHEENLICREQLVGSSKVFSILSGS